MLGQFRAAVVMTALFTIVFGLAYPRAITGVAGGLAFVLEDKVAAADNRVDPTTGTMRCQAVFENPDGLLVPGMFVRVRLATSAPYKALLINIAFGNTYPH